MDNLFHGNECEIGKSGAKPPRNGVFPPKSPVSFALPSAPQSALSWPCERAGVCGDRLVRFIILISAGDYVNG
jgi:hypothetical protein